MKYPSNLTEQQWLLIEEYFYYGEYGNRSKYEKKKLVEAVLYVTKTGCQWRQLPREFPPWQTVYSFFRRAKSRGVWEKVLQSLVQKSRLQMGRKAQPTYGVMDSQSVKTTSGCESRGFDGGKKGERS